MSVVKQIREPRADYRVLEEPALLRGFELLATAEGGVEKLRKLIRSLAVRGLLATQRPSDESAKRLLVRLREVAEGTRSKGAQGTNNLLADITGFTTPVGWAWTSLSELGRFASGKTPSKGKAEYWNGTIPWVSPKDMKSPWLTDSEDHVSEKAVNDGLAIVPESSVLIVVRSGILRRTVPVAITAMPCTVNQDLKALTLKDPTMAAYVQLLIGGFESFILSNLTKIGTTVESMKFDEFSGCRFPLPPLAEQHRIVARVEELMTLCDELEARGRLADEQHAHLTATLFDALTASDSVQTLADNWQRIATHFDLLLDRPQAIDALEQTILQLAVRGLLVSQDASDEPAPDWLAHLRTIIGKNGSVRCGQSSPRRVPASDEEPPFNVPCRWAWARFASVARIASDLVDPIQFQHALQVAPDCIEKATGRLIATRSVRDSGVISANHRFHAGQILYSKIRPSLSKVVIVDFDGLCSADMYPIDPLIDIRYLHLFMLSDCFLEQVKVAENRVKMPKLNQEALNSFHVAVPPLAEQHRIVACVEQLRRLCTDLRERLNQSRDTQTHLADVLVAEVGQPQRGVRLG